MTSDALQSAAMVIEIDSMATTIVCGDETDAARSGVAAMRSDQSDGDCCVARFATRTPVVPPPDRYSRTMKISLLLCFCTASPITGAAGNSRKSRQCTDRYQLVSEQLSNKLRKCSRNDDDDDEY